MNGKPIFTLKENDDSDIPREDAHKEITTHTTKLGGTARREQWGKSTSSCGARPCLRKGTFNVLMWQNWLV